MSKYGAKQLLALLLFLTMGWSIEAQLEKHITWKSALTKIENSEAEVTIEAKIDSGWHLYGQYFDEGGPMKLTIQFAPSTSYELIGEVKENSTPKKEFDEIFQVNVAYFEHAATFKQRIKIKEEKNLQIEGKIEGQICQTDGSCMLTKEEIKIDSKAATTQSTTNQPKTSYWSFFIFAFLGGLLAILTPCVFPMIPMTVSFFMHGGKSKTESRIEAIVFGSAIIGIYTIIGTLVAAIFGPSFANYMSTHWLPNLFFFAIFMFFAASFFGMFEIVLPSWIINKSDKKADQGGVLGAFFMAFTLVLVSFSCTGPIVGAVLVESAGGEYIKPIVGMVGFSSAFALPFTLFALFPSLLRNLPKSGGWLHEVKVVLGFIELALGLKFLSIVDLTYHWHLLNRDLFLIIWIVIFILMGFYLLGQIRFEHDSELKKLSFPRLMLVIATFSFVLYMIPGLWGAPLKALAGYIPPMTTQEFFVENNRNCTPEKQNICEKPLYSDFLQLPHQLQGYFDWDQALACAKEMNKPIFVDFTGHGCANCRKMEENVWSNPEVLKSLQNDFIILSLYVDEKQELPKEKQFTTNNGRQITTIGDYNAYLQETKFNSNSQPQYIVIDKEGNPLTESMFFDLDVEKFKKMLEEGRK